MSNPFNESDLRPADTSAVAHDPLAGALNEVFGAMQADSQSRQGSGNQYKVMASDTIPPVRIIPPVPGDGSDAWHGGPMGGDGIGMGNGPDP